MILEQKMCVLFFYSIHFVGITSFPFKTPISQPNFWQNDSLFYSITILNNINNFFVKSFSGWKLNEFYKTFCSCTAAKKFSLVFFFLVESQFCTLFTIIYLYRQKTLKFNHLSGETTSTLSYNDIIFGFNLN